MKPRIVFLHYHGIGHINQCLPLASILENENYEVHFAGVGFFSHYVLTQGFSHYALKSVPFGLGFETWMNTVEKKKNIYLYSLHDRITDRLYRLRYAELLRMLDDIKPEIILIDATQPTDFIILYSYLKLNNIKVGVIHAMSPTHVIPGRPPVNSFAFPEDEKNVLNAIRNMKRQKKKKAWTQKAKFLFFDDQYIINRRLKKNKIPLFYCSATPSLFNFTIQNVNEFVLAPREFDFPDFKVEPMQHYIGFMIYRQRNDLPDPEYIKTKEMIHSQKAAQNAKLIYCSFGTIESDHKEIILSFLNKLINIAIRQNYLLIISMKAQSANRYQLDKGGHVYFFKSVPQVEVLSHADLFITHGGLSSIKESIDAEVPMLMYPVHADFDPMGNSARVVYHGMGLRGDAENDTETEVQSKITELLTNPIFKEKVLEMKRKNAGYTAENFMKIFKTLSPLESNPGSSSKG